MAEIEELVCKLTQDGINEKLALELPILGGAGWGSVCSGELQSINVKGTAASHSVSIRSDPIQRGSPKLD